MDDQSQTKDTPTSDAIPQNAGLTVLSQDASSDGKIEQGESDQEFNDLLTRAKESVARYRKGNKRGFDPVVMEAAYVMYLRGEPNQRIADELGVMRQTVSDWSVRRGWNKDRESLETRIREKTQETLAEGAARRNEQYARQVEYVTAIALRQIRDGQLEAQTLGEAASVALKGIELQRHILGLDVQKVEITNPEDFRQRSLRDDMQKILDQAASDVTKREKILKLQAAWFALESEMSDLVSSTKDVTPVDVEHGES